MLEGGTAALALPEEVHSASVVLAAVSIRDVSITADIGVHAHEIGQPQPLLISVTLRVRPVRSDRLEDTIDYTRIVDAARALGAERIGLVETFAARLAEYCLQASSVEEADVLVEKPHALASGIAGARIVLRRTAPALRAV